MMGEIRRKEGGSPCNGRHGSRKSTRAGCTKEQDAGVIR